MTHKQPSGDTIIEVLISIAIISLVITGAYAIANRSLHQGITASEHTQALKLAQGQLEELKFRQQLSTKAAFLANFAGGGGDLNYCLRSSSALNDSNWNPVPNSNPGNDVNTINATGYNSSFCINNNKYYININVDSSIPYSVAGQTSAIYWITVKWNAIGGGVNATQLYYRF